VTSSPNNRLLSVDALRGIAVLSVLFYHSLSPFVIAQQGKNPWLYGAGFPLLLGYSGVHLFLVLSGFCIHLRFARQRPPRTLDFGAFWKRRFLRLYPPYVAAMLLGIGLVLLTGWIYTRSHGQPSQSPPAQAFGLNILAHLLMLHIFTAVTFAGVFNGPLWSLALEEQLYALYMPFLWLRRHWGLEAAVGVALTVTLSWRIVVIFNPWHPGLPLLPLLEVPHPWVFDLKNMIALCLGPARWIEWCLGALAVEAYFGNVELPKWCYNPWVGALFLLMAAPALFHPFGWVFNDLLFGLGYFIWLNHLCRWEKERPNDLSTHSLMAPLAGIGLWSYSLYLLHAPVMTSAHNLLATVPLVNRPAFHAVVPLAVALLVGRLFFRGVERHFLNRRIRSALKWRGDDTKGPRG
jgi:peptidoglycan/LPS O-acetylase OafA/YrhL